MRVSSESRPSSAGEGNGGAGKALLSPPERNPGGWIADSMLHPPGMALEMGWDGMGKGGGAVKALPSTPKTPWGLLLPSSRRQEWGWG